MIYRTCTVFQKLHDHSKFAQHLLHNHNSAYTWKYGCFASYKERWQYEHYVKILYLETMRKKPHK